MKKYAFSLFLPSLLLILLAFYLQKMFLLSGDVGYLAHVANQLIAGGTYAKDFFETNPPMILYVYLPGCLLAKYTSLGLMNALQIYIFSLGVFSYIYICILLRKIIKPQDTLVLYIFSYVLLFLLLFMPINRFGQREHILMMFMLPYLFSAVLQLDGKSVNPVAAIFIGLFAGIGFALKPFFLVTPALVELYFIFKKRQLWGWVRIESVMILLVMVVYLGSIFIFQPSYIKELLPLVSMFYFVGIKESWIHILTHPLVLYCFSGFLFYAVFCRSDSYSTLSTLLMLALIGMIMAFMIPRAPWFYHVIPALTLSALLMTNYFAQLVSKCVASCVSRLQLYRELILFGLMGLVVYSILLLYSVILLTYTVLDNGPHGVRHKLITFMNSIPGQKTIACFSPATTEDCFPLVYATNSLYGSRYPFFWWMKGMLKLSPTESILQGKKFLLESVADDLHHYPVKFVIINAEHLKEAISPDFDIISYLSTNQKFKAEWQHYHYLTSIDYYKIYERDNK